MELTKQFMAIADSITTHSKQIDENDLDARSDPQPSYTAHGMKPKDDRDDNSPISNLRINNTILC